MLAFNIFVIIIGIASTLFLFNSFTSFQNFHQRAHAVNNWDTMILASSTRVSKESSAFLTLLSDSLRASIQANGTVDPSFNQSRRQIILDYLSRLDLDHQSQIRSTIDFGLNPYGSSKAVHSNYQSHLIHSDYLPAQLSSSDKVYASTLISSAEVQQKISLLDFQTLILSGDKLKISADLLSKLLSPRDYQIISASPDLFNLEINSSGLDLSNIPNGIQISVEMPVSAIGSH